MLLFFKMFTLSRADLFATSHFLLRSNYQSLQKLRESQISNDTKISNSNSPIEQPPSFPSSQDKAVENHLSGGMTSPVWEAEHRIYLSLKKVDEAREESLQWRGKLVSYFDSCLETTKGILYSSRCFFFDSTHFFYSHLRLNLTLVFSVESAICFIENHLDFHSDRSLALGGEQGQRTGIRFQGCNVGYLDFRKIRSVIVDEEVIPEQVG